MEVVVNERIKINDPTAVAIGNFDGLHIGHQALINTMVEKSKKKNLKATVFTFFNHTASMLKNRKTPNVLSSHSQTTEVLNNMSVELLYMINFNKEIMLMTPRDFIQKILVEILNAKLVVIGFNFRFGYKAKGDAKYLEEVGKEFGIEVIIIQPIYNGKDIVSSSFIRNLIESGKIEEANKLIGRPYTISGKVIPGKGRGKKMGTPTANIEMQSNFVIPQKGVYKTVTKVEGITYRSVTNVGQNPTFNEKNISIETYLLDFNRDIYEEYMEVSFLEFMRDEIRFKTKLELIEQMERDIDYVRYSG